MKMTDTIKQAEPVAWATFDGEGSYELRLYENNESYRIDYYSQNGAKYKGWVKPLYAHPAPALTAELKAELLDFLVVCSTMHPFVVGDGIHKQSQRLITKLTNLEVK